MSEKRQLRGRPPTGAPLLQRRAERGFSLVIAVSIIGFLAFLGTMTFNLVTADVADSAGHRIHAASLSIAETGLTLGETKLSQIVYNGGLTLNPSLLTSFPALSSNDLLCSYTPYSCSQWYDITGSSPQTFSNGTYRLAATCVPGPCTSNPNSATNFLLRSAGMSQSGNVSFPRVLESILQP